nr:RHS repeat domain-containing protein [Serratia marcescens]
MPPGRRRRALNWNAHGQLAEHQDALGSQTRWQYNALGLPVSITDRINRTRRYHLQPAGWLTRWRTATAANHRFSYDAVGRVLTEERRTTPATIIATARPGCWKSTVRSACRAARAS